MPTTTLVLVRPTKRGTRSLVDTRRAGVAKRKVRRAARHARRITRASR